MLINKVNVEKFPKLSTNPLKVREVKDSVAVPSRQEIGGRASKASKKSSYISDA